MSVKLSECKICYGCGRVRQLFGKSFTPKCTYISCDCGLMTPICDTEDEAIKIWNWLNRESYSESIKTSEKQAKLKAYQELEDQKRKKEESLIKSRIARTKEAKVLAKTDTFVKPKRHRRTKAEMEAARALEKVNTTDEPKKKRHRRTKAEMEAARAMEAKQNVSNLKRSR